MSTNDILELFRGGDEKAFREIYKAFSRNLLYYSINIVKDREMAEDVVSEAFVKLYKRRLIMESMDHIKRSLYIMCKNKSIDLMRRVMKERKNSFEIRPNLDKEDEVDLEHQAKVEMLKSLLLDSMMEELAKLPNRRRTIIWMYFFKSKTTDEIARDLHLNTQTVLNHKTRGLDHLRKIFSDKGISSWDDQEAGLA